MFDRRGSNLEAAHHGSAFTRMRGRRDALLLALAVSAAAVYGLASSRLPAPDDPTVFWIANLAAPYVLMPLLAGALQRSRSWAAAAGIAVCATMIAAFYQYAWYTPFVAQWLLVAVPVGLVSGLLGHALRTSSSRLPALAPGLVLVFEPLYWHIQLGFLPDPHAIWLAEAAAGIGLTTILLRSAPKRVRPEPDCPA